MAYFASKFFLKMKAPNLLKASLLIFCFGALSSFSSKQAKPCDEIEVSTSITHSTPGQANGEIELTFRKSEEYTLFLFSGDSRKNQLEIKGDKVTGLEKGEYTLYVQNKAGCTKQLKIKIN